MLILIGTPAFLLIYFFCIPIALWKRLACSAAVLAGAIFAFWFAKGAHWLAPPLTTRGAEFSAWDATPLKETTLLISMIIGMFLRAAWDSIDEYRRNRNAGKRVNKPRFDKWDFVMPAIIALVVFQPVLSSGETQQMSLKLRLFSLQNGFFWNSLFSKLKAEKP